MKKYGTDAKAFVDFVIDSDGKVINVKMLSGITEEIDQEIIKIIKSSPDWVPWQKVGKHVPVKMVIPINFEFR